MRSSAARRSDGNQWFVVPDYLPPEARELLPWTRRHVARVAVRYGASRHDVWDEAVTALLRAAHYYRPEAGAFGPYARTAVHRGVWTHAIRRHLRRPVAELLDADCDQQSWPSAEDEYGARELVAARLQSDSYRKAG